VKIKIGCCGFPVGMKKYFQAFRLVEIQKTFYQLPGVRTAQKWKEKSPQDFEFTLKASQVITHPATSPTYRRAKIEISTEQIPLYGFFKPTKVVIDAWEKTAEIAKTLAARIIVFQCPASFKPSDENIAQMRTFFQAIDRGGLSFAWEPRGDWPDQIIEKLCLEFDLIHCVDPLIRLPVTEKLAYFRLHGGPGYYHKYTDKELYRLT